MTVHEGAWLGRDLKAYYSLVLGAELLRLGLPRLGPRVPQTAPPRLTRNGTTATFGAMFGTIPPRFMAHAVAAVAMFFVAGGHWGALQTVAWAGMLWNYTQADGSLLSGVKKTFDGEHPCTMCDSIKTAKEKEQSKPVTLVATKKLEACPAPLRAALPPRDCRKFVFPAAAEVRPAARADAPPVPVPIADLV